MGDMTNRSLRVLLVGLGSIGQRHVRNLRRLLGDGVELSAVRARGRNQVLTDSQRVETQTGLLERYAIRALPDLGTALGEEPDAVFVTNPSSLHMEVALRAARQGCHLFIEKPLATSDERLDELVEVVERNRIVALVGYQLRFHPCFERLHVLLAAGRPGCIVGVRAVVGESLATAHPYEDYRESYAARRDLGGGVLLGLSHEFDYLQALLGTPRRVFALGGRLSDLEIDVEDTASVLLDFSRGSRSFPAHVHLDYLQRPPVRSCEILGDDGRIVWDYHAGTVDDLRADGRCDRFTAPDLDRNHLFQAEIEHFLRCLRGDEQPRVTVRDAAASVRIALAARRSLETGAPVSLGTP
jgi:predicted dehydrogenase